MNALQKTFVVFVVTVFVMFGGFAAGLAQGTPAVGMFLTAAPNHELPGAALRLHDPTPPLGLDAETASLDSTYKHEGPCQHERVSNTRLEAGRRLSALAQIPSRKVSLRILQSVFLL